MFHEAFTTLFRFGENETYELVYAFQVNSCFIRTFVILENKNKMGLYTAIELWRGKKSFSHLLNDHM